MPNHWIAIAAAVFVGLLSLILLPILWALLVCVAAGAAAWFFSRDGNTGSGETPPQAQTAAVSPQEQAIEALLDANLRLRRAICPAPVVERYEGLIDKLLDLAPVVNAEAANTELAWVINQMSLDYLPKKSLGPYLGLDREARHEAGAVAQALEGLDAMSAELDEVRDLIDQRRTGEFDRKAEFLKRRFE